MKKECGKCNGKGGRVVSNGRKPGWLETGKDWKRCDACGGSGQNPKYRERSCAYCHWGTVGYSSDNANPPLYCSESCKQDARREADSKRRSEQQQSRLQHNQHKRPERPSYSNQPRQNSDWLEKSCPGAQGSYCSNRIRYKASWDNTPTHCDQCKNREFEKACANSIYGCDRVVKFKVTWKDVPDKCGRCRKEAEGRSTPQRCPKCSGIMFNKPGKSYSMCFECSKRQQSERPQYGEKIPWPDYKPLPASDRSVNDLRSKGITGVTVKQNPDGGYHVTMFSHEERYSYDTDPRGNFIQKRAHYTDKAAELLGKDTIGPSSTNENRW